MDAAVPVSNLVELQQKAGGSVGQHFDDLDEDKDGQISFGDLFHNLVRS